MKTGKPDLAILLGPNGVGKTHICHVLERNGLFRFYSIEEFLIGKYKSLSNFQRHREEGYVQFEKVIHSARDGKPIIFEESGISDEATRMIGRLKKDYAVRLISVSANLDLCIGRVERRGIESNFPKSAEFVKDSFDKWESKAKSKYVFDMEIVNNNLSDRAIVKLFSAF